MHNLVYCSYWYRRNNVPGGLRKPMRFILAMLLLAMAPSLASAIDTGQYLVVVDRVQDLRREPVPASGRYVRDELQLTQVLYNDVLIYTGENQQWYQVEVPDQLKCTGMQWEGYRGWIPKKSVRLVAEQPRCDLVVKDRTALLYEKPAQDSPVLAEVLIGTKFGKTARQGNFYQVTLADGNEGWISQQAVFSFPSKTKREMFRHRLVNTARIFEGTPYLLGGRSVHAGRNNPAITGVDGAGLVSLILRAAGIDIPRTAQDQWSTAEKILMRSVKPGDLIFLSQKESPEVISHVMLYLGDETFIEAPESGKAVTTGTLRDRFGAGLDELTNNAVTKDGRTIYFSRVAQLGYSR